MSVIAESAVLPEGITERVRIILQAAVQMDTLIQDLLDVTRLEAGRLTVTARRTPIHDLMHAATTALRPLAEACKVGLEVMVADDVTDVLADPERITQAISNLVGNSLKFTASGGHIALNVTRRGGFAEFQVRDNGVGIPPDQLAHVFERFYKARVELTARRHGAGLGLPIARGIVEAHGGSIRMESEQGHGTVAVFTLPFAD